MPDDQGDAIDRARREADQHRRGDGPAQVEAHHRGELDVAHPHPALVGEGDDEEHAGGGGGGDQPLGQAVEVAGRGDPEAEHGADDQHLVRDQLVLEVGDRDREQGRDEDQGEGELGRVVLEGEQTADEGEGEARPRAAGR